MMTRHCKIFIWRWIWLEYSKPPLKFIFRLESAITHFTGVKNHEKFIILAFKEHLANRNRSALFLVTMYVWVSFWPRKLSHARIGNVEVAVTKILVASIFPPKTNNCNLILSLWSVLEPVVVFQLFYRCWLHKCNRICILSSAKCILLCLVWHICLFSSEEWSSYLSC